MMEWMEGLRWDHWVGGLQLLLSALILARLRRGARKPGGRSGASAGEALPGFEGEILIQILRQQAEQSLWRIRAAVEAEQARLEEILSTVEQRLQSPRETAAEAASLSRPFRLGEAAGEEASAAEERYAGLVEQATAGCPLEEAAQRSGLSLDEAELALKVRRAAPA
ncbi:MAG: hypothetical protein WHT06_05815 [Desulfobacterales bacterium]